MQPVNRRKESTGFNITCRKLECVRERLRRKERGGSLTQKTTELTCHGTNCFGLYVAEPNHLELQV